MLTSGVLCDVQAEQNFMGVQGGYVTYRVNTQTSMPTYPRSGSAVRRRFRDFVVATSQAARSCLCIAQGCMLPCPPVQ